MLGAPRKCVSQNAPCLPMLAPQLANRALSPTQLRQSMRRFMEKIELISRHLEHQPTA